MAVNCNLVPTNKTKKIKKTEKVNKKELWDSFDENETSFHSINNEDNLTIKPSSIECIFRNSGEREICECCDSMLALSE